MTNPPKEQTPDEGRKDGNDQRVANAPNAEAGSPAPDSPAPILMSEDDELFDEDAPE